MGRVLSRLRRRAGCECPAQRHAGSVAEPAGKAGGSTCAACAAAIPGSTSTRSGAMPSSCWCASCAGWSRCFRCASPACRAARRAMHCRARRRPSSPCPKRRQGNWLASLAEWEVRLRGELAGVDAGIVLACSPAPGALPVLAPHEQGVWLASLHAAPHGVRRMSRQVPGIVETSNNLGMVDARRVRRIVQFHGSFAARQRQRCTGGRDRQSFFAVRDACREGGRLPGMGAQSRFAVAGLVPGRLSAGIRCRFDR